MPIVVNTNQSAIQSMNRLALTTTNTARSLERVSSGLRVNHSADDASGFSIADGRHSDVKSMRQATRNLNDGLSAAQEMDGTASEVANMLKRMRELAVQSSSEVLATDERGYVQSEFVQLSQEVERMSSIGDTSHFWSMGRVGVNGSGQPTITVDVQAGINGTANDRISLSFSALRTVALGISTSQISLNTTTGAQSALSSIDAALTTITSSRTTLGAAQNRLETALRNLQTQSENTTASRSRVLDADYAHETAELAKNQVLQQSGVAVLGQSNALPQAATRLLP